MFTKKLLTLINPIQSFLIRLGEIFLSNIGVTLFQNDIKIPLSVKMSRSYCITKACLYVISMNIRNFHKHSVQFILNTFKISDFLPIFFFRCTGPC